MKVNELLKESKNEEIDKEFNRLYSLKAKDLEKEINSTLSHRSTSRETAIFSYLSKKYGEDAFNDYLDWDAKR